MEPGAILVGMALLLLAAAFIFNPFLATNKRVASEGVLAAAGSETRKREALAALNDLDFDFQTGKVSAEDHAMLRAQLLAQAALLMEEVEREEHQVEALIHQRRQVRKAQVPAGERQGDSSGESDRFCPHCGRKTVPGGVYCPRCGRRLVREGEAKVNNNPMGGE